MDPLDSCSNLSSTVTLSLSLKVYSFVQITECSILFQLDGRIALSVRGNCAFTEEAGASALLVINDKEGLVFFAMGL